MHVDICHHVSNHACVLFMLTISIHMCTDMYLTTCVYASTVVSYEHFYPWHTCTARVLSIYLSVLKLSRKFICSTNDTACVMYYKGVNICGIFSETAPLQRYTAFCIVWLSMAILGGFWGFQKLVRIGLWLASGLLARRLKRSRNSRSR